MPLDDTLPVAISEDRSMTLVTLPFVTTNVQGIHAGGGSCSCSSSDLGCQLFLKFAQGHVTALNMIRITPHTLHKFTYG